MEKPREYVPPIDNKKSSERKVEHSDISDREKKESQKETVEKQIEQEKSDLEEVRKVIKDLQSEQTSVETNQGDRQQEIQEYFDKNVPEYLQRPPTATQVVGNVAHLLFRHVNALEQNAERAGKELFPKEGGFLVVTNHFGGETPQLMGLLSEYKLHIAAGEELNFNRSKFRGWLLKKLGMIPVYESLAHVKTPEEKDALLSRVPSGERRGGYQRVLDHNPADVARRANEFAKTAAALLAKGDVVAMMPEGLFAYEEEKMLQEGYGGMGLIAAEYKKLTGQDLKIIPVAMYTDEQKTVNVGEPLFIPGAKGKIDKKEDTDSIMTYLASMMPEKFRGYYKDKVNKGSGYKKSQIVSSNSS